MPSAESSASLIALQPRLDQLSLRQDAQAYEVADLRSRSAAVIERWYELGVVGKSECWTEWEGRLVDVEKKTRRKELHRAEDIKENDAYR